MLELIEDLLEEMKDLRLTGAWELYSDILEEVEELTGIEAPETPEELEDAIEDMERLREASLALQDSEQDEYTSDMMAFSGHSLSDFM